MTILNNKSGNLQNYEIVAEGSGVNAFNLPNIQLFMCNTHL